MIPIKIVQLSFKNVLHVAVISVVLSAVGVQAGVPDQAPVQYPHAQDFGVHPDIGDHGDPWIVLPDRVEHFLNPVVPVLLPLARAVIL